MLGVSRPTLIKLLDDGEIPYSRPNSSRRIPPALTTFCSVGGSASRSWWRG
ncbi:hypothetical protein [Micromonospora sp. LOL_021]|uniref:hypothetical protein n=1 Tax=Micromonospora sp. LOL_021 TaxID=3345417 RepID=UPI003A8A4B36